MALPKITTADVQNCYVQGQPDKLTGTAQQNKAVFDALPQMIVGKHNDIIDTLNSTTDGDSGADNIGATAIVAGGAENVQGILGELDTRVQGSDRLVPIFEDINSVGPVVNDDTVIPTAKDIVDYVSAIGNGDMMKAVYDTDNDGIVDNAENLGGKAPTEFVEYADLDATPTEDSTNGVTSGGVYADTREQINANKVNRNLLDNPYFKIDQRKGYIVPPNKNYYSDTALTTLVGQTSEYTTVTAKASGYNTINIGGTDYYVAVADCVRGYCEAGYTVDRWSQGANMTTTVTDDGITFKGSGTYDAISERLENPTQFNGKTLTLSAFLQGEKGARIGLYNRTQNTYAGRIDIDDISSGVICQSTFTLGSTFVSSGDIVEVLLYQCKPSLGAPTNPTLCKAVKLEYGTISTLEAEIASGNYDEKIDLRNCKEYQKAYEFGYGLHIDTQIADGNGVAYFNFPIENPRTDRGTWVWLGGDITKLRVHNNSTYISPLTTQIGNSGSCLIEGGKALLAVSGLTAYTTYTLDYYSSDNTRCKLLADFNL